MTFEEFQDALTEFFAQHGLDNEFTVKLGSSGDKNITIKTELTVNSQDEVVNIGEDDDDFDDIEDDYDMELSSDDED